MTVDEEERKKKETDGYGNMIKEERGGEKNDVRKNAADDGKSEIEQGLGIWVTL